MIAVPFVYFSILLIYILKKKKSFDISAYLVSLFWLSSFFSILIDVKHLRSFDTQHYEIGIEPTLVYLGILTFVIWPFYKFEKIKSVPRYEPKLFNAVVYFFLFSFLFILLTSFQSIIEILSGDLGAFRSALGRGEDIADLPVMNGPLKPLAMITGILGGFSIIMLLFYFYSVCFLYKSNFFNFLILLSSLSMIIIGILGVDRSKTIYWLISYGFMLVLFWRFLHKKRKRTIGLVSAILIGGILIYFMSLTISRFGERDAGTEGGMISYAGQSFINFCYFYDNIEYSEFSLQRIFPLFYKLFVDNGIENPADLDEAIALESGKSIAIFSTFIGNILVSSGKLVVFLYCISYGMIVRMILKGNTYMKMHFDQFIILFLLISIPLLGLFAHFYAHFPRMIVFIIFIFYALYLRQSRIKCKKFYRYSNN